MVIPSYARNWNALHGDFGVSARPDELIEPFMEPCNIDKAYAGFGPGDISATPKS
jgi:hypothetical protein